MIRRLLLALAIGAVAIAADAAVPLVVNKSQATVSDPFNGVLFPKAIPGAQVDYTISVTNPLTQYAVARSVVISDAIPAGTKLYVGNLDSANGGPAVVTIGVLSSATYSYLGLQNATDGLEFSSDNGANWTYQPSDKGDGCDPSVTNIRVKFGGSQAATETVTIRFRTIVK